MILNTTSHKQGLYDPYFEHDACGIGFVANIKGIKSHELIEQALLVLKNLHHRGATGSDKNTGDGAGILIQIPHKFFKKACTQLKIQLPNPRNYGVGMMFLPQNSLDRKKFESLFEKIVEKENQVFLGWRNVPLNDECIGYSAKSSMPFIKQVFIGKGKDVKNEIDFERKLYIIRKIAEKEALENNIYFYSPSLSSRTIVYKGMLTSDQVNKFYKDLSDYDVETSIALIHSRYSTNTFPSWERAHPNRYIIHNGEINTLRGNVNWMNARESLLKSDVFGEDLSKLHPIINQDGSDSSIFDNCLEFLSLSGRSLPHSVMMMIPEPWSKNENMDSNKKAFYEYHSCLMEPWDGPTAIAFTDGRVVGAVLDRNGLRPSRYYITNDDLIVMSSEVGVLNIHPSKIILKERLKPGKMLLVDTKKGKVVSDKELKSQIALGKPYKRWINKYLVSLESLPESQTQAELSDTSILVKQKSFGYTYEDLKKTLFPMVIDEIDPIGAMGMDAPLAILSKQPQLLYNYFKQLFAQVTNPPIDAIREEIITSTETFLGSEGNLLNPTPQSCRQIKLNTPILDNVQIGKIKNISLKGFISTVLPICFKIEDGGKGLSIALENLFKSADQCIESGTNIIILSDKEITKNYAPMPALLAVSGLHHHLIKSGTRPKVSLVVESGEPREVHHFSLLIGYGASAINPYLALDTITNMLNEGMLPEMSSESAIEKYIKSSTKGIVKVLSKMGISTIQSYQGSQIFEAIGINNDVINKYFTATPSRIGGICLDTIAKEINLRYSKAFDSKDQQVLDPGGYYKWQKNGEYHLLNPESIRKLQQSCQSGDYNLFKKFSNIINEQTQQLCTLRGLLEMDFSKQPVPLEEVESIESICKRFKTGAMSYGAISQEAHECIAIAMNKLGGKSNSGEGGESPQRFIPLENGDSKSSAIKQVASGRFGVNSNYLINAKEIQIKMSQGAKPGEGGQLPGRKVYPWVAKSRGSTPGVGLISPPPHHDIYSIEDLSQLIHDLKNANSDARISVKLVSEVGVGTIAAGVAKGKADIILISGYDGGTGASPITSIKHTGLPWELGLAETHQTLLLNNLRSRVVIETDGKLLTGKDVVIAAMLGAEEFGFSTAPLVTIGCTMDRVCNLDTCPVGIATQNPQLRKRFKGKPEYIINFMYFIAQETRELMAKLGFRKFDDMIGRVDKLKRSKIIEHFKAKEIDLSNILYIPKVPDHYGRYFQMNQDHNLSESLDSKILIDLCKPSLLKKEKVSLTLPIKNTNRVVGTLLGSEVTKKYGEKGLPEDTIHLTFKGSAGQSFGAFIPPGITLELEGDSNDYIGKGICGGKIIIYPPKDSLFTPEENIIIGNVAFYGATKGEAYIRGIAGERFCVRNSGVNAVVEGIGDHGCEYMTGGTVIILGRTGRNFAAGMSGGIAYVYDKNDEFQPNCNKEMVDLELLNNNDEIYNIKTLLENHTNYTDSELGKLILSDWNTNLKKVIKVIPKDYKRMMESIKKVKSQGLTGEEALMAAFEANHKDSSRISGN